MSEVQSSRFEVVDALRGIAAFAVLVYHARAEFTMGASVAIATDNWWLDPTKLFCVLLTPFSFGFLGVDLFFVLSGFCIHYKPAQLNHVTEWNQRWGTFFWRRFVRLYPTYICSLILAYILYVLGAIFIPDTVKDFDTSLWTLLGNLVFLEGLVTRCFAGNTVLWTLVIEVQLYLLYPLFFVARRRFGIAVTTIFAFLISLAVAIFLEFDQNRRVFVYWQGGGPVVLKYWFSWILGAVCAEIVLFHQKLVPRLLCSMAIPSLLMSVVLFRLGLNETASLFNGIAMAAILLFCTAYSNTAHNSIWFWRPFAYLGIISYSLYIIHRPSFIVTNILFIGVDRGHYQVLIMLTSLGVAWLVAMVLFYSVERRSIVRGRVTRS